MRLFASVDCAAAAGAIASVQERFADLPGVRLTDPETAHVTLAFLGEVDADRRSRVERAMAEGVDRAAVTPFEAVLGGLGVFPDEEYISVIWVGVREGGAELERLHNGLVGALTDAGVAVDTNDPYVPHVTIARVDHGGAKERIQDAIREDPDAGRVPVDRVALVESELSDDGPAYETIATWDL